MPLPRRPRGEQPITTIRWQRRQMLQMEQTIADLKATIVTKDRQLGDFELQLNETGAELFSANTAAEEYRDACDALQRKCDAASQRLTWYEGFAAGIRTAQEIQFPGHPAETHDRTGPADQSGIQDGRQATEKEGCQIHPPGDYAGTGNPIRSEPQMHHAHPAGNPMEECKVGEAYDGVSSGRYRRTAEFDIDQFSGERI